MSVIEEHWDYQIDIQSIEKKCFNDFELSLSSIHQKIVNQLEDEFKIQKFSYNGTTVQTHDDELKAIIEKNKQLRHDIDLKLQELSQQQAQYEIYKKDQKLLSQEIKETHEAFLMAKKFYKKYLKMYYTIECKNGDNHTVYLQFFSESKKDSENYSARLMRNTKTGNYELLSVTPKLHNFKELKRKLQETNDVPGTLCCIRQAFVNLKMSKK